MNSELQLIPLRAQSDKDWEAACELYENAFPQKERRSIEDHLRALEDSRFSVNVIHFNGEFAGIFFFWVFAEFCYGEYLAILPQLRGHNIGSKVIDILKERYEKVVLEIDPPEDEMAIRRLGFYERAGFVKNPQLYIHPSFCRPFEPHQLILMSYPNLLTDLEFEQLMVYIKFPLLMYSEQDKYGV